MNNNLIIGLIGFVLIYAIECASKNYYDILGVQKDASTAEIKKAFRNLALKHHPDKVKNPDKDTEAKFREMVAAYEVLSDPDKRRAYDQTGNTNFESGHGGGDQHFHQGDFNFNDFFKNFDEAFKNHQNFHQQHHEQAHWKAHHEHMRNSGGFHFNFDDLFDDDDGFGDFGGGFGGFGGFPSFGGFEADSDDLGHFGGSFFQENTNHHGQNCKTIQKRQGNTIITHTECH